MPPSDFSVPKNLRTKTHIWKSHAELSAKQLPGFYFQRNVASSFISNETFNCHVWGNFKGLSQLAAWLNG